MGEDKNRSTVSASLKENVLYISLYGTVSKKEVEKIYTDIRFCVPDLRPGFSIITDLTHCRIGHLSGITTYKKIMAFLVENRVGQIIRVVGRGQVIFNQLSKLSSNNQNYRTTYVSTMADAESYLAQLSEKKAAA